MVPSLREEWGISSAAAVWLTGSVQLAFGAGPTVLMAFCVVWGASVIADSGVFSTSLSEVADPR